MAPLARRFTAYLLADSGCADDAEVITAELVGNALLHTRSGMRDGWFGVQVVLGEVARVAVRDLGGGVPVVPAPVMPGPAIPAPAIPSPAIPGPIIPGPGPAIAGDVYGDLSGDQEEVPLDELRESGRGLLTVARLARAFGFDGDPASGHTVWAELDLPEGARAVGGDWYAGY